MTRSSLIPILSLPLFAATPVVAQSFTTHIESGDAPMGPFNDVFSGSEEVNLSLDPDDCLLISGKLQEDCVWGAQPSLCLALYSAPFTCEPPGGGTAIVDGATDFVFAQPPATSASLTGPVTPPITALRFGVGAFVDCFDGALNGLFQSSSPHEVTGAFELEIEFRDAMDAPVGVVVYEGDLKQGRDGFRIGVGANEIPGAATSFVATVRNDVGQAPVCYDVDHYTIKGLEPLVEYTVEVVSGVDCDGFPTDTTLGWLDSSGDLILADTDSGQGGYSKLSVIADVLGEVRIAVTGNTDDNFNGLDDIPEVSYLQFLFDEGYIMSPLPSDYDPGASAKDDSVSSLIRLSADDFDDFPAFQSPPGHSICGCYTISVKRSVGPGGPCIGDLDGDGGVGSADLATLIGNWGPCEEDGGGPGE